MPTFRNPPPWACITFPLVSVHVAPGTMTAPKAQTTQMTAMIKEVWSCIYCHLFFSEGVLYIIRSLSAGKSHWYGPASAQNAHVVWSGACHFSWTNFRSTRASSGRVSPDGCWKLFYAQDRLSLFIDLKLVESDMVSGEEILLEIMSEFDGPLRCSTRRIAVMREARTRRMYFGKVS